MNIEDERKEKNMVCFAVIKVGKAFEYNNDIYIKVDEMRKNTVLKEPVNAIGLLNGTGRFFMSDSTVLPLDAKVVIQNDI